MKRSNTLLGRLPSFLYSLFLTMALLSNAWAMHRGINCSACHKLLQRNNTANAVFNASGVDKSMICLSCHDANQDRSSLNPPYVLNGNLRLAGGTFTPTLYSDQTGHNILSADAVLWLNPPGGNSMNEFGCLSCHDPHDNGNYRNLKTEINGRPTVIHAVADPAYQANLYISGMDDFCAACHEQFHGQANTWRGKSWVRHPTGITIYGARHADFAGWSSREPVLTLVENPLGDPNDLYSAKVFCLSCHYAHAGPYDNAVRWDNARSNKGCLECHSLDDD